MIESLNIDNVKDCTSLAHKLWPDSEYQELLEEFMDMLSSEQNHVFLYYEGDDTKEYLGFLHLSLRTDYVEGSLSSPVAYIEGIYVEENHRRRGIAGALVKEAEEWAREKGCSEMGSDCELTNNLSEEFHKKIGFKEANRLICFIKEI